MREKIAEIIDSLCRTEDAVDKILQLIHSEMVGLVPAEMEIYVEGYPNIYEERNKGYNTLRSELLSAIEKKFKKGEAL